MEAENIADTLAEREKRYGSFEQHAEISDSIQAVMEATPKWKVLKPYQREALRMNAHKIGRILNGDPDYDDSWHDISGYSTLVRNILRKLVRLGRPS